MSELSDALDRLAIETKTLVASIDVGTKTVRITELEASMSAPGFWDDQTAAQTTIGELKALKDVVDPARELEEGIVAASELLEMAEADGDEDGIGEIKGELDRLRGSFGELEKQLALSGPYDRNDVFLSINPGAGGTDAADFAGMLLRMYSNYCQKAGYKVDVVEMQPNEEAGLKSVTLNIKGANAYGYFKSEMGTHRLVRMSPFNSSGTRETSFAAVEVTPELPDTEVVSMEGLDDKEFRIDTFRASGAGGQHINKTDSAVRITHVPTGVVTSCQSERSQNQNKAQAWKMMVAKLQQLKEAERLKELQDLAGERGTIGWGHQIRSYVLQPTQLITDLRSRYKEGNATKVLDGDIQPFIDAYLRWRLEQGV